MTDKTVPTDWKAECLASERHLDRVLDLSQDTAIALIAAETEIERLRGALLTIKLDCASAARAYGAYPGVGQAFKSTSDFASGTLAIAPAPSGRRS